MYVSCHRSFLPGTSLEPEVVPTDQASSFTCSTFRIMCDVPSIAVFCSESIEHFPGTASKFYLKLLVTIPVAPIITGMIVHFRFHIRCIFTHKLLYFNLFSASFCTTFLSAGIATSISVHVFSFLFLIIIFDLFAVTSLSVCTARLLLLLLSSSPLCRVFIHIFLRQTMSLGNTVFQLFCHYYLWCPYR